MDCEDSNIKRYFKDKTILLTGGTGTLGKLFIEKLLRDCHRLKKIYVIIREKHGLSPEERLDKMFSVAAFNPTKIYNPNFREQVKAIKGDTEVPGLGISEYDRELIINEVEIFINCAATVRFVDPLKKTIPCNVRSTRDMLDLAREAKNLKLFCHISTAYAFFKKGTKVFYEKCEETPIDALEMIKIVENTDEESILRDTKKYLHDWPNTYTFSKALAEGLVMKRGAGLPRVIIRPSLMMPADKEPLPGWIDNKFGLIGPMVLISIGMLHIYRLKPSAVVDYIPSDYVINGIIAGIVDKANMIPDDPTHEDVPIYSIATSNRNTLTMNDLMYWGFRSAHLVPNPKRVNHVWAGYTTSWYLMRFMWFFVHTIKAYVYDFALQVAGYRPVLKNYYKMVIEHHHAFMPFESQFKINDDNMLACYNRLTPIDKEIFYCDVGKLQTHMYLFTCLYGGIQFILKGELTKENLKKWAIRCELIKFFHYATYALLFFLLYKCAFWYVDEVYHTMYFGGIALMVVIWNLIFLQPSLTPFKII